MFNFTKILDHDAEAAVILAAGFRAESLNHFELQHEGHVLNQFGVLQQMKHHWC